MGNTPQNTQQAAMMDQINSNTEASGAMI